MSEFTLKELFPLIEEGIGKNGSYRFYPNGKSMLPLIRQKKDSVVLRSAEQINVYDIVLYVRKDGSFVLHRVVGIDGDTYNMCGDNQCYIEKGIRREQIKAIVSGIYKDDKYISVDNKRYLNYVKRRVKRIPWRLKKAVFMSYFNKIFHKKSV